jgi:hypothetical protein
MEFSMQILLIGGLAIAAIAWLWLIVRASREGVWWGIGTLLVPPTGLVFALRHAQKAIAPLVLFLVGILSAATPAFTALMTQIDLGRQPTPDSPVAGLWSQVVTALKSDEAHEWMEIRSWYWQFGGAAVAAAAWIWLIVRAFRQQWKWGAGIVVLPPTGLVFAARHPRKGAVPLLLVVLSLLVAATPAVYTKYVPLLRNPRDVIVEGERHVTLTGSDRKADSGFEIKPDTTVLQMANSPDVTDQTLESLRGLKLLKELDLNDTPITDAGLMILRDLPALERLRLARTKVTDKGFREALFDKDSLMQLDLQGTQVSRETMRAWRDAKPGRRVLPPPG